MWAFIVHFISIRMSISLFLLIHSDYFMKALAAGLHDPSALFKHEIAYVCGQMQNAVVVREMHKVRILWDMRGNDCSCRR